MELFQYIGIKSLELLSHIRDKKSGAFSAHQDKNMELFQYIEINHCQPVCNNEAPHEDCSSETHIPDEPNLKRHFSFPNNEKLNVCKICQKKFANKFNLTRHMKVHNGEYECCVCHKIWFSKSDLSRHMAIHNGQKLYECDICEKRFSLQQNLAYHMRAHIGNQPYECQICKKTYTFKCHLTLHMKFHNGEKPYECKICHNNFTQRSDLNKHMRIHYQENQYACGRCVKRFAQKSNLIRHMRQHHGFDQDNSVFLKHASGWKPGRHSVTELLLNGNTVSTPKDIAAELGSQFKSGFMPPDDAPLPEAPEYSIEEPIQKIKVVKYASDVEN
ncbi:zinc finger protein OZF-like [Artemia franciscana]|uniref:zinc finger protein OZF-like n=1 Tax=Artemia franciscana TaxID=6661 RepID=UPI0032DA4A23